MAKYNKPSILDEIASFKDCEVALLTTFNFDIPFFERSIRPPLSIIKTRICVFVDSKQLQESISKKDCGNNIGKYYFVQPYRMEKSFHPKLVLLLAKDRAKLIVSSANLTYSSYYSNNEIFQSFTYNKDNIDHLNIFVHAFKFFSRISKDSNQNYINELISYCEENYPFLLAEEDNTWPLLLTSYSESILGQVIKHIPEDVKEIIVATPFYDDELGAIKTLKTKYKDAQIKLFVQNHHSTFPKDKYSKEHINQINIFETINNNEHEQKQFYHGKVFCLKATDKDYILYGSPNCSISALVNPYTHGGNIEVALLDQGNIGDFDSFFDAFKIENATTINDLQINDYGDSVLQAENDITFVNGCINGRVFVQVKSKLNLDESTITINDVDSVSIKIEKYNNGGVYTLSFSKNALSSNIFDLVFIFNENTIKVRCFVCDIDYLNYYIHSTNKNPFSKLNTDEDMERYKKDSFLERFQEITNDIRMGIQESNRNITSQQANVNDDTVEIEDEEESALDYIMYESTNSEIVIGNHDIYLKANAYLSYFAQQTSMLLTKGHSGYQRKIEDMKNSEQTEEEKKERVRQKQSFSSKLLRWFEEYAKISNTKLADLDFYTYFNLYELISGTFICDMYITKEGIKDLPKLVEIKIDYLLNRVIPYIDSQVQQSYQFTYLKLEIALLCIECYTVKNDLPFNAENFKEKLFQLDRLYSYTFIDELKLLIRDICLRLNIDGYINIISYFNNFFINAPKTDELEAAINKYFGFLSSSIIISFDEEKCLTIKVDEIDKKRITLALTPELIETITNHIIRYYGNEIEYHYSFKIILNDYSEHISCLSFEWIKKNPRKYTRKIYYKAKVEPNIDLVSV